MKDHIIETRQRLLDQIKVNPETPSIRITRSPFRVHRAGAPHGFRHAKTVGPFRNPGSGFVPEFPTIPCGHPPSFIWPGRVIRDHHGDPVGAVDTDLPGADRSLPDPKPQRTPEIVMCLARYVEPLEFPSLFYELALLVFDSSHAGDNRQPEPVFTDSWWGGDPDPSSGRVDPYMQVLDRLPDQFNRQTRDLDLLSIHDGTG